MEIKKIKKRSGITLVIDGGTCKELISVWQRKDNGLLSIRRKCPAIMIAETEELIRLTPAIIAYVPREWNPSEEEAKQIKEIVK